jgi:Putative peptidoglycan binding domain
VPRKATVADDDEAPPPRRRRGAAAAAIEPEVEMERGLALRILLYSPKDMFAGLIAFAAVSAIITNAVFLQTGPHPAPMFGSVVHMQQANLATVTLPRPRPAEADAVPSETHSTEPHLAEPKVNEKSNEKANELRLPDGKGNDPLGNLVKATVAPPATTAPSASNAVRPPAPIPPVQITGSRKVAAVQRALTEYGYGQLKATGTIGADTQTAIMKFERDRRLPVTGQVSERLVHDLNAMIGHPID